MMPPHAIADTWKGAYPPPAPYVHVLRRTFPSGLHVLVLVREADRHLTVLSAVDHGTAQDTLIDEGRASSPEETAARIEEICERWDRAEAAGTASAPATRLNYFHAGTAGRLTGPVSRDTLFELIAQGVLRWEDQVWEETDGPSHRTGWSPLLHALGSPKDKDART